MNATTRNGISAQKTPPQPRLRWPQWRLAVDALSAVFAGATADAWLQEAFRKHREMGGRDRARVGELVYGVLRDLRRLQAVAGTEADEVVAYAAVLALREGLADVPMLVRFGVDAAAALQQRLAAFDEHSLSAAQRCNLPDAVYQAYCAQYGEAEAQALGAALRGVAPVDLRVNVLRSDRDSACAALADAGIEAQATPLAPWGLRLHKRASLQATLPYREGWIEPQDEGSQLLAHLVSARAGMRVADYCAGAGGKTLALAAAMRDQGELWALDISVARLERLQPRLQRAGITCVQMHALPDASAWLAAEAGRFDAVLVDAPCSGSGTWRRQPELRLRTPDLTAMAQRQGEVLRAAARLVRPGGRLVYATCSLLREENDAVVDAFLAAAVDFQELDAGVELARQGIEVPGARLRLLPHRHGTDGFFAACLQLTMA